MEQKNSNVVTFDDLARFTEEVLLPGIEQIMDDKLEEKLESKFNEKLAPIYKEMADMRNEFRASFADVQSELHSIKLDLNDLREWITRLEKMAKGDLDVFGGDIITIKKELKHLQLRVNAIGA